MLRILLKSADQRFEVESAGNALEALERIGTTSYDAYILDVALPAISGIELCKRIRANNKSVPIVFYTARADAATRQLALDAGADAVLAKPNDLDRIAPVLARFLKYEVRSA